MWIVRLALRRPYTFVVGAMLIVILGVMSVLRTPTDVFPPIDIPVISMIWQYNGLPALVCYEFSHYCNTERSEESLLLNQPLYII